MVLQNPLTSESTTSKTSHAAFAKGEMKNRGKVRASDAYMVLAYLNSDFSLRSWLVADSYYQPCFLYNTL